MSVNVSVAGSSTEITVSGGIGPKGEDGAAGVSSVNGLTGAVTLAAVGASVAQAGQTITITVTPGATTWDDLTGKPATFPPSTHTHVIADVTGLQTALDGKAAAVHTHTASAITDFSDAALAAVTWTSLAGKPTFASVATSGSYGDLLDTPLNSIGTGLRVTIGTLSVLYGTTSGTSCQGNDPRLSDARTPTSHTHTASAITDFDSAALAAVTWTTLTGKPSFASVATSGAYSDLSGTPSPYTLPVATASVLGGVKIGSGVSVDGDGVISVTTYTLPAATTSTLGGMIVGTGLSVSTGTVSVSYGTTAGTACEGNDARLSDARTPTSHVHAGSDITTGTVAVDRLPVVLEKPDARGNSGSTITLSLGTGSVQTMTLSDNCVVTMPAATNGASITLIVTQGGGFTCTFTGVLWPGGAAPTITATADAKDILVFVSDGTSWFGTAAQGFA